MHVIEKWLILRRIIALIILIQALINKFSSQRILKTTEMKVKSVKTLLFAIVLLASASSLTSCNRGYGCPNNFSLNEAPVLIVTDAIQAAVK